MIESDTTRFLYVFLMESFFYVAEHAMISCLEAAASWRKCLAEVPFTGIYRVSVIHPEQGWKIERIRMREIKRERERYTEKDRVPILA